MSTKHELKEVLIRIIARVDNLAAGEYELLILREDEKLCRYLCKILKNRTYMIVLDDVGDAQVVEYLRRSLPDQSNGSLVCITTTTSFREVAQLSDSSYNFEATEPAYFLDSFWFCLRLLIFGYESIPPELEEIGKKIIENCRGLVISVARTILFLLKSDKTVEQWSKIAADKENPIFMIADEISEIRKIKIEMQTYAWDMDDETRERFTKIISGCTDLLDYVEDIKKKMHPERFFSRMQIISLLGMAGIGKTTFARKIFKDKSVLRHFDHRVWITLGPKYQAEEILIDILAQIYPGIDKLHVKGDEKLTRELCAQLSCKRCLIVLYDLCSKEPLCHLKNLFPDIKGTTLVTTRLVEVGIFEGDTDLEMQLLDKEESWCLIRQKVFGEGVCPPELEKAGRQIAEKCDGLSLLILTVADQLLKVKTSEEYWNNVASGKEKSVFMNAHHQISEALLPSYQILPQHLKVCFLYMGVFRDSYEVPTSNITNLWIFEGFLEPNSPQMIQDFVTECLCKLVDRSLVMMQLNVSHFQMKTCRLHSVFWHLSNSEAVKIEFFHAMNSYDDCFMESISSQRRLCIRNSILLGMKDVQDSMASITSAHSLLCVSPPHQYPVPISFGLMLLRVMDALTIRLYEFPIEVVKLIHLRYLALTCNGKLPTSISKLWKLQHLIVSRYMNTKSTKNSSPLPMEIWDMKELKHLQIMGGHLPNPKCGASLPNLSALLDVSAQSCTPEVLEMIPNLKRLGIRIELVPGDEEDDSFRYLNNISRLDQLESLKCVVVNPRFSSEAVPPPAPISMLPSSLNKLSLSGFGFPWEYMSIIGKLENLEVLKLKSYAFRGEKWEVNCLTDFLNIKFILIEDTDLVRWESKLPSFNQLECLSIRHCYKLQELPAYLSVSSFRKIEIVDCYLAVPWAEQLRQMLEQLRVEAHFSLM